MGDNTITGTDLEVKHTRALKLRIEEAASYRQIADAMDCSVGSAYTYVQAGLAAFRESVFETVEEVQRIELQRLDLLYNRLAKKLALQVRSVLHPDTRQQITVPDPQEETVRMMKDLIVERLKIVGGYAPSRVRAQVVVAGGAATEAPMGEVDYDVLSLDELRELDRLTRLAGGGPALKPGDEVQPPGKAATNGNGTAMVVRPAVRSEAPRANGSANGNGQAPSWPPKPSAP